jgi:ATP-dependent helicase/nuclease subunit A
VLVLVRQRGPLFEAVIRALKNAGIAVAGADRLVLTEHIAVMDLLALADCLLLPDDDLALASVLRSPLFGLSDVQLFDIAFGRKGSLRASLRGKPDFATTNVALDELANAARRLTPFGFFTHVLGAQHGRAKFLVRLGLEANDALDEFLNLALDYERRETPSLQGFVNWLRAAQSEVKRDMEMLRDEVRVMTVHGAKGLEAHTVILADTTTPPTGPRDPRLLAFDNGALVWATARGTDVGAMSDARSAAQQAARDEYRRLLYVAMTRAKERLVIAAAQGCNKIPDGCWYQLVDDALREACVSEPADDGDGEVLRFRKGPPVETAAASAPPVAAPSAVPDWLRADASSVIAGVRTVTPSSGDDDGSRASGVGLRAEALLRGSLTHRLLQSLPDIPVERRAQAAEEFLARSAEGLAEDIRQKIKEEVDVLLNHSGFAELFAPGSRAEVPIVGRLILGTETIRVSGQVDRLVMTERSVLIADFKTDRSVPSRIAAEQSKYAQQLALYRAVLAKLYPEKTVRAALIWTEVPDLMELSAEALDVALARITSVR